MNLEFDMNYPKFWSDLSKFGSAVALIESISGRAWTYEELSVAVRDVSATLSSVDRRLVFFDIRRTAQDIIVYLALLEAGHVPCLFEAGSVGADDLVELYRPEMLLGDQASNPLPRGYASAPPVGGLACSVSLGASAGGLHPALGLLLSTSGSTGNRKMIRLSRDNLAIGAAQVSHALRIGSTDRALTHLQLSYVYGLSVLHSHLAAGASVVVDDRSVVERDVWRAFREHQVTTLSGVPWSFKLLRDIGFERADLPALRKLTVAGGAMNHEERAWLVSAFAGRSVELFFMYGQTEASGRIAVLPPELAAVKPLSSGLPVPLGALDSVEGMIRYRGPNVMLGYARGRDDLARGDDCFGILDTGDTGHLDPDGCLVVTGRGDRYGKLFGVRIDLEDIELFFEDIAPVVAVLESENRLNLIFQGEAAARLDERSQDLARKLRIPRSAVSLKRLDTLPRRTNGKLDYAHLRQMVS